MAGCFGDGRLDPEGPPSRAVGLSLLLGEVIQIPGLSQQTFSIGQGDAAGATQAHLPLVALWLAHSILQRLSQTEPPTRNPTRRPECRGSRRKTPTLPYRGGFVSFGETQTVKMRDGCLEKKSPSRPPPKSQCLCETAGVTRQSVIKLWLADKLKEAVA